LHITTTDHSAGTNNDLECPIYLKVRFTDGTLDVGTLWLLDSTIRIGVARGGGRGVGWRAYPPPCGQLTRCFSAVAELLVYLVSNSVVIYVDIRALVGP